jgi:hypothetical protein
MLSATTDNLLIQLRESLELTNSNFFHWYAKYNFKTLCTISNKYSFTKEQRIIYCDIVNSYKKKFVYDEWDYDPESITDSLLAHS